MAGLGRMNSLMSNPMMLLFVVALVVGLAFVLFFMIGIAVMIALLIPIFIPAILVIIGILFILQKIPSFKGYTAMIIGLAFIVAGAIWWYYF